MSITVVFFDIDDTLVDHSAAMSAAAVALHDSLLLDGSVDDFHLRWKAAHSRHYPRYLRGEVSYEESFRNRVREVIQLPMTDEEVDALFATYLAEYERRWVLFPDVLSCLNQLRPMSFGIISNGPAHEQRRKLKVLGLEQWFRCVCISEDVGIAKPDRGIFLHACELAGVTVAEAVYVGDHYELDARAAHAAGLHSVWLNRRAASTVESEIPEITSLASLPALLGRRCFL